MFLDTFAVVFEGGVSDMMDISAPLGKKLLQQAL